MTLTPEVCDLLAAIQAALAGVKDMRADAAHLACSLAIGNRDPVGAAEFLRERVAELEQAEAGRG
jgi:hypothetical protein